MNVPARIFKVSYIKLTVRTLNLLYIKNQFNSISFVSPNKCFHYFQTSILNTPSLFIKRGHMDLTTVTKVFEEIVPSHLSEKWDNTGLLIEPSKTKIISSILFTNDLTEAVLGEAVAKKSDLIIAYHPPIFAPLKSLTSRNWKERIVIKCIENSIAVYSPHTSCDAVAGGVNDWLINCFDLTDCRPIIQSYEFQPKYSHLIEFTALSDTNMKEALKSVPDCEVKMKPSSVVASDDFKVKTNKTSLPAIMKLLADHNSSSIHIFTLNSQPLPSYGMGRIGKLTEPLALRECIKLVKQHLNLNHVRFSQGVSHSLDTAISVVAVCAGSGSSVLKGVNADLYITGEMSHHDLLDANHRNVSVILCEHSNSERGYLQKLVKLLSPKLSGIKLIVSAADKDPVSIV